MSGGSSRRYPLELRERATLNAGDQPPAAIRYQKVSGHPGAVHTTSEMPVSDLPVGQTAGVCGHVRMSVSLRIKPAQRVAMLADQDLAPMPATTLCLTESRSELLEI